MKLLELNDNSFRIFCDLDGCLVDFVKGVQIILKDKYDIDNASLNDKLHKRAFWGWFGGLAKADPKAAEDFWANLPWMPDGKQLWNGINKYNPTILSSPGTSKRQLVEAGKVRWLQTHGINSPAIFKDDKESEVKSKFDILIDDRTKQTDPWKAKGGTAILHVNATQTLNELDEILKAFAQEVA